jgi:hypothetical protein
LALRQQCLVPQEFLFGSFPVIDICVYSVPLHNPAGLIPQRVCPEQKPTKLSIMTAQSRLSLARQFRNHDALPCGGKAAQVIRMNGRRPSPIFCLFRSKANIVEIVLIEEFSGTIRMGGPRECRNRVDDLIEILFASTDGILSAFPIVDVDEQYVPAGDAIFSISHWQSTNLEPSINTIGTAASVFDLVRLSTLN